MGIRFLNKFLVDNCSKNAIKKMHFKEFKNKIIVIDSSIYLYKYIAESALIENLYLMVSILKHYGIIPIFIFDGKPPQEKKELLIQRLIMKKNAEQQYNELKSKLEKELNKIDRMELQEIKEKMELLKRQFIRISDEQITIAKKLLSSCGIEYYDAEGEADKLCAQLVITKKAWACISDDMDMIVYGCKRVIRQISLMNHTCVYYDMDLILKDLDMSMSIFRQIMVISGTDYNINNNTNLNETIKWYYEYQKYLNLLTKEEKEKEKMEEYRFYKWLQNNTKYINNYDKLEKVYNMFIVNEYSTYNMIYFNVHNEDKTELIKILETEGFIFCNDSISCNCA